MSREERLLQAYEQHKGQIFSAVYGRLKNADDSQEVLQEAFMRCWRKRHLIKENYAGFLYRTAVNVANGRMKRRRLHRNKLQDIMVVNHSIHRQRASYYDLRATINDRLTEERVNQLVEELKKLPDISEEVLRLRFIEGLEIKDVAKLCNIPEGTVRSRTSAAVIRLKKALAMA